MKTSRALALTAILYFLYLPVPKTCAQQLFTLIAGNLRFNVTPVKGTVLSESVNPSDRFKFGTKIVVLEKMENGAAA